jgi:hypothetical protein
MLLYSTSGNNRRNDIKGLRRGYSLCWKHIRSALG